MLLKVLVISPFLTSPFLNSPCDRGSQLCKERLRKQIQDVINVIKSYVQAYKLHILSNSHMISFN